MLERLRSPVLAACRWKVGNRCPSFDGRRQHTISWDNPSHAPFYVKYEADDDIEDVSGSPAMFINDTKMIISVGNDFGEDDIVNVEIQFADGTIQSFSVAYGEEVEKQFYLDQDIIIVINWPDA